MLGKIKIIPKRYCFTAVLIIALVVGIFVYFLVFKKPKEIIPTPPKEKTMEEILQSLTAPTSSEAIEVPESVIESLTAPPTKKIEIPESIIQSLTAPK